MSRTTYFEALGHKGSKATEIYTQAGISDIKFRYNTKMEGYPTSMSDIPMLSDMLELNISV